jgi:ankyrin repeat protein
MAPDDMAQWTMSGQFDIVHSSLERGADANTMAPVHGKFYGGMTLLNIALTCGQWDVARPLVAHGADVKYADPQEEQTTLHVAVAGPKTDAAALLLDHGADRNARTALGVTPVMLAAGHRNRAMVQLLIDRGADVRIAAPDGLTAIIVAHESGDRDIEALLAAHGAFLNPLTLAKRKMMGALAVYLFGNMH